MAPIVFLSIPTEAKLAIFYLTYTLHHEDGLQHYQALREELTRLRAHQVGPNSALINLNTVDPKRLIEALQPMTEEGDRLFAVRLEPRSYWYVNALSDTNDWLKTNKPVPLEEALADLKAQQDEPPTTH
ncbi:MAG: hypothetical protein AAF216_01245 [Pseudomonadota bacterium]